MANWSKCTILDGWAINHTSAGYSLNAQFRAVNRADLPSRGDKVPITGVNAPPRQFTAYRVSDVVSTPLTSVGPYIASVTISGNLGPKNFSGEIGATLSQTDLSAAYMDFHIKPEWCGVRAGSGEWKRTTIYGWNTGKWVSAVDSKKGTWKNWLEAATYERSLSGSPFRKIVQPALADETLKFLSVTVSFHTKESTDGLEKWGGFSGIVPVNSFPKWITIPGGDNRWRLYDEDVQRVMETDGKTQLFKVTRILLGIPPAAKDVYGKRLQWDQKVIGQRDWKDL